jgi:serine/threonine-protein kinase HipA
MLSAFVNIWGERVGAVAWDSMSGLGTFEFEDDFHKKNWDLSPIKMPISEPNRIFTFPELRTSNAFKGLPGLLADVLPDKYGNALINAWLTKQGRPTGSLNPVEILCFIGKRGMGALEFEPVTPKSTNTSTKIEIDSLIKIAEEILSGRQNFNATMSADEEKALLDILKIGTSAGGARAKALIALNPTTMEVRSGQAEVPKGFEHWLIKFDGIKDSQFGATYGYGKVELAYNKMALDAGIEMTECRLLEEHGRAHFMTRRFDRPSANQKIHVQSFCAMQHYDFNEVDLYSYEQLFETMRMLSLPYPQAEQLFRRMSFNVMARNCDDHTKNFSFIMDKQGNWQLSPAFDVCHAYRPGSPWVSRQSLSVNGKREAFDRTDLLSVAKQMTIKKAEAILNDIKLIIQDWNKYAKQTGVDLVLGESIKKTLMPL